ncbi:AAA family ATPase [Mycobacterium sp.]|uniref:AAA family ATPase n=1 Tax=Mycobacterium sp. TaxID=1785 RepID=UPI00344121F9
MWCLAQEILSLGLSVVVDFGLWARIERDEMRTVARGLGVGVEVHYLEVPSDVLWRTLRLGTRRYLGTMSRSGEGWGSIV